MPIHPQSQRVIELLAAGGTPLHEMSAVDARARYDAVLLENNPVTIEVAQSEDFEIPGPGGVIGIRSYVPHALDQADAVNHDGLAPALVFFHGGGWVIGSVASRDQTCRALATEGRCIVYSVDYRLAPEHPFPAAVDDAYAAAVWIVDHARELGVDSARIALGGDSGGGNLAAVVTHLARDRAGPSFAFQLLIYPATDAMQTLDLPSYRLLDERMFITPELVAWYRMHYFPTDVDPSDIRHSPALAGNFRNLPPAFIQTAELDPIRDDGMHYGELLAAAGVAVDYQCYPGQIHGFFNWWAHVDACAEAHRDAGAALRRALAPSSERAVGSRTPGGPS